MRFIVSEAPVLIKGQRAWKVVQVEPQPAKVVAYFVGPTREVAQLMAGDYVEFLNEKYVDKEINKEWPPLDKKKYIEYYKKRLKELEE